MLHLQILYRAHAAALEYYFPELQGLALATTLSRLVAVLTQSKAVPTLGSREAGQVLLHLGLQVFNSQEA